MRHLTQAWAILGVTLLLFPQILWRPEQLWWLWTGGISTAPGRAVAAPAAVFSRVSTPEAQPRKGKRTAAGFGPADQGAKKRATRPELKHPPRAANGTCVMPNPPAAVAGFP